MQVPCRLVTRYRHESWPGGGAYLGLDIMVALVQKVQHRERLILQGTQRYPSPAEPPEPAARAACSRGRCGHWQRGWQRQMRRQAKALQANSGRSSSRSSSRSTTLLGCTARALDTYTSGLCMARIVHTQQQLRSLM
jgi:hypothetical protein